MGLIGHNSFVGRVDLIGMVSLNSIIGISGFDGLGLIGFIGLNSLIDFVFIGCNGLVGWIGLISFIGPVKLISVCIFSLAGLSILVDSWIIGLVDQKRSHGIQ